MKTNRLLLILFIMIGLHAISYGQDTPKFQYSIGAGVSIDNNVELYGVHFSNELNVRLGRRTSFNTNLTFYQSLGSIRKQSMPQNEYSKDQSSGIFITPSLKWNLNIPDFNTTQDCDYYCFVGMPDDYSKAYIYGFILKKEFR